MFTGIIESIGTVVALKREGDNLHISCTADIASKLKIDQSVSHNGVCLTIVEIDENIFVSTAIKETLSISNLGSLKVGDKINLERSVKIGGRLDGHIVQGHVDITATCHEIIKQDGSWIFGFHHQKTDQFTVDKGSVCVNGVSLTVLESMRDSFSVAIIPYTFHNTNFESLNVGNVVNIEFDIIGKYISKITSL